jgi:hypothetical protein
MHVTCHHLLLLLPGGAASLADTHSLHSCVQLPYCYCSTSRQPSCSGNQLQQLLLASLQRLFQAWHICLLQQAQQVQQAGLKLRC